MTSQADVIIVGGGLAGGLTALRFAIAKPETKILLVEESHRLGGFGSWHFFDSDLTAEQKEWILPLVAKSWPEFKVQFPKLERSFSIPYHLIRSEDFHDHLAERLQGSTSFGTKAVKVTGTEVELASGKVLTGRLVLDARGADALPPPRLNGYQKCLGFDVTLEEPHGITAPVIMDATCPQMDGLRYFALLPWDSTRLHVMEAYCSDNPEVNVERITKSIRSFCERKGWKVKVMEREEKRVFPAPMTAQYIPSSVEGEPIPIGSRGGYFHAATGNALPDAVRIAEYFAALEVPQGKTVRDMLHKFRRPWLSRQRFFRVLNRVMFYAAEPSLRYQVMQRLYEQPVDIIARFHAGKTSWGDRLRLLSGKSPVPLERAFNSFTEKTIRERAGSPAAD